jgi:hypothetical protein
MHQCSKGVHTGMAATASASCRARSNWPPAGYWSAASVRLPTAAFHVLWNVRSGMVENPNDGRVTHQRPSDWREIFGLALTGTTVTGTHNGRPAPR